MAALDHRHGGMLVRVLLPSDLDLGEEVRLEPLVEDLVAHRSEGGVARWVAEIGEGCENPVGSLPLRVHVSTCVQSPVGSLTSEQRLHPRRPSDLFAQRGHSGRGRVFTEDLRTDLPADRWLLRLQEHIDDRRHGRNHLEDLAPDGSWSSGGDPSYDGVKGTLRP